MKKYVKIYLQFFGYSTLDEEYMPCEVCSDLTKNVHHIDCKGMGGSKEKDFIENLMGLCVDCHEAYGDKKQFYRFLIGMHRDFISIYRSDYEFNITLLSHLLPDDESQKEDLSEV